MVGARHEVGLLLNLCVLPVLGAQVGTLTASENARIKGDFSEIGAIAVTASGQILLTQPQDHGVRLLDQDGKQVGQFGRNGEGPGEFIRLGRAGVHKGGFWVNDPMAFRLTLLSSSLALIRTVPIQAGSLGPSARIEALAGDDTLLISVAERGRGDRPETGKHYYAVSDKGRSVRPLGGFPSSPECLHTSGTWTTKVPYCERRFADVSADGSRLVLLTLDLPHSSAYRVTVVKTTGDTLYSRAYPFRVEPISRRFADSITSSLASGSPPPLAAIYRSEIKLPESFPPITRVVAGGDGSVWLEEHSVRREHSWLILDSLGRQVGRVSLPRGFRLLAGSLRSAWGVESDADDLQAIVRYQLH